MRRENSKFNSAYVSHEGNKLFNNDYYGSAELDQFACYVIADGLDSGDIESQSARVAVQAAMTAFYERPSIGSMALKRYVKAAHAALSKSTGQLSQRASITVVVTDYQSVRYAWAGNTRFYLYRAGRIFLESADHSLARQMADKGELPIDRIAKHEERDNLSRYAGQSGGLSPQVSKKIKLQDGDTFALLTRGVWELADSGDFRVAIDSAENHPNLALDWLERLLLDPHPDEIDNYTAAVVFIDKVFTDPNREKKIKRILAVVIPLVLIIAILTVILLIMHNKSEAKRHDMEVSFLNAVEYINDENYPRADSELTTAANLAAELKDRAFQGKIDNWRKFVDAVLNGDELYAAGNYDEARGAYMIAQDRSRFTDNAGLAYVERRLDHTNRLINVRLMIALGDTLVANNNYALAEENFMDARLMASIINDGEGQKMAMEAMQNLYGQQDRSDGKQRVTVEQQAKDLRDAADMETMGDRAAGVADNAGAKLYYTIATDRYFAIEDYAGVTRVRGKLSALSEIGTQNDESAATAGKFIEQGTALYEEGNYVDAKAKFILARNIYARLGDEAAMADVLTRIELCDNYINGVTQPQPAEPIAEPVAEPDTASTPDNTGIKETQTEAASSHTEQRSEVLSANTETKPAQIHTQTVWGSAGAAIMDLASQISESQQTTGATENEAE